MSYIMNVQLIKSLICCANVVPMVCSVFNENSSFVINTRISPESSSVLITWINFVSLHRIVPSVVAYSSLALLNLEYAEE
ncbi:hypothetical protein Hanom_Chr03g00206671 [Helianthus anomalus]